MSARTVPDEGTADNSAYQRTGIITPRLSDYSRLPYYDCEHEQEQKNAIEF